MIIFRFSLLLALLAGPAAAQEVALPSGLPARLFDVVLEGPGGEVQAPDAFTDAEGGEPPPPVAAATDGVARFRLLVDGLGGTGGAYADVAGDFLWVCEELALPALGANGWVPSEVVVTLADREVAFGESDAQAVQFFEGFRVAGGACVPQAF